MKKLFSFLLAWGLLLSLAGCGAAAPGRQSSYARISAEDAQAQMQQAEAFVLLDVRTPEEYAEGHIEGALLIPHTELEARAGAELPNKELPIFVYCRSGNRSKTASLELLAMGYTEVYDFGGISGWPYGTVTGE